MVFVLLAVLVGAAYVGTARASYGDYAAAKMPQYGSEEYRESQRELAHVEDDYQDRDRSPEAPASPDYKYEEDLNVRSASANNEDDWLKTSKGTPSQRRLGGNLHSKELVQNNGDKIKPKIKQTLRRHSKWRNSDGSVEINRIPLSGGRIRSNDIIDKDDEMIEEKYEPRYSNEKNFRITSEKIIRRKPRDRADTSTEADSEEADDDDDDEGKNDSEGDKDKEGEYPASDDLYSPKERFGLSIDKKEDYAGKRPLRVDDDIIARLEAKKLDQKSQEEYQDYYDMKRVNNIKKKITVLYRRTKARATGSTTSHRVQVWTYRRSYVLDRYSIPTDDGEELIPTTTRRRRSKKKKNRSKAQMKVRINTTPVTNPQTTVQIKSSIEILTEPSPVRTQAEPQRTTTISLRTTTVSPSTVNATNTTDNLSMAEKSRLSILKKTLLKESLLNKTTVKPPVFMHVSHQMNTVVMVEPTKSNVNMQLMGKFGPFVDSPERIARVKSIMRRRLIASARRIEDLTDKWDEMVCDYIDVSQLDYGNKNNPSVSLIFLFICLLQNVFGIFNAL